MNEKSFYYDVLCLQETWLNKRVCFSLLDIEDYNFIPQSFLCSAHGGLAFYLQKNMCLKNYPFMSSPRSGKVYLLKFQDIPLIKIL